MPKDKTAGRPKRPASWVRKNMAMDQRKLTVAKKYLGAGTETEAVDAALDMVAFQAEMSAGLRAAAKVGPWKSPYYK